MDEEVYGFIKNPSYRSEDLMSLRGLCKEKEVSDQGIQPFRFPQSDLHQMLLVIIQVEFGF